MLPGVPPFLLLSRTSSALRVGCRHVQGAADAGFGGGRTGGGGSLLPHLLHRFPAAFAVFRTRSALPALMLRVVVYALCAVFALI